jgi:hypothetical protein
MTGQRQGYVPRPKDLYKAVFAKSIYNKYFISGIVGYRAIPIYVNYSCVKAKQHFWSNLPTETSSSIIYLIIGNLTVIHFPLTDSGSS